MKKYYIIYIKINRCNWALLYMCYVAETYGYIDEGRKEAFFNRIMGVLPRKNRDAKER